MALSFEILSGSKSLTENEISLKMKNFKEIISNPKTQFFNTFKRAELFTTSIEAFNHFGHKKYFVHVGIGGSSLGPEMLVSALQKTQTKFIFINNIDPEEIHSQLRELLPVDINECLFYFVSKSGGTAETMAALSIVSSFMEIKKIPVSDYKKYMIFATDPKKSELLDLANELSIKTLEIPSDVGGRFSVLTPVGFLPAIYAGINLDYLYKGAIDMHRTLLIESNENPLLNCAHTIFDLYKNKNINQTVMMPYSSKLKNFSCWFSQLWGESLGKKFDLNKNIVNVGLTPISSYGATDQHSTVQLFMEGPNDKLFLMIEIENFSHDFSLNSPLSTPTLNKLKDYSLSDLLKAELEGTIKALMSNGRPIIRVKISRNDEYHLAGLILFFEALTALMGNYLSINPFDQPGVEAGKIYAFEYLNQL